MSIKAGIRQKLNKRGFSLAEMLLAMLIMLLVSLIMASGIPAVKNAYEKVVVAANADVYLSTTVTALRNELATAKDIKVNGDSISFYHLARGAVSKIEKDSGNNNQISIQRYADSTELEGISLIEPTSTPTKPLTSDPIPLVVVGSELGSWDDLYVTYDSVSYSGGIITFTNLAVKRKSGGNDPASISSFKIRVISSSN